MPFTLGSWLRVLVIQGGIGLAWLLGAPARTNTKAYLPAIRLGGFLHFGVYPIRIYGAVLIVIALGLSWCLQRCLPGAWRWSLALAGFWTFWAILYTAAIAHSSSLAAPLLAAGMAWYAFDYARHGVRRE